LNKKEKKQMEKESGGGEKTGQWQKRKNRVLWGPGMAKVSTER